jgi:nucleoprotein TPR
MLQERQLANDSAVSGRQYAELMEKINELNVLRESNAHLREEANRSRDRVILLERQTEELNAQLDPLKEQLRSMKAELGVKEQQVSTLERDNERWRERTKQVLEKYDRIDPEEVKALKADVERLQTALDAAEKTKTEAIQLREVVEEQKVDLEDKNRQFQLDVRILTALC